MKGGQVTALAQPPGRPTWGHHRPRRAAPFAAAPGGLLGVKGTALGLRSSLFTLETDLLERERSLLLLLRDPLGELRHRDAPSSSVAPASM